MKTDTLKHDSGYVAIFWLDLETCKVFAVKSPLNQSEKYGDFLVHKSCHFDSWSAIQKRNPKWTGQYEDYCRGRCVYHQTKKCFYIYVCPLVKDNKKAHANIVSKFNLSNCKHRFLYDDEHYFMPSF